MSVMEEEDDDDFHFIPERFFCFLNLPESKTKPALRTKTSLSLFVVEAAEVNL